MLEFTEITKDSPAGAHPCASRTVFPLHDGTRQAWRTEHVLRRALRFRNSGDRPDVNALLRRYHAEFGNNALLAPMCSHAAAERHDDIGMDTDELTRCCLLCNSDPTEVHRPAGLGIIVNWTAHWSAAYFGEAAKKHRGGQRWDRMYRFQRDREKWCSAYVLQRRGRQQRPATGGCQARVAGLL
jgi:hypothetical protein